MSEVGCLACDLTAGRRELPGGRIYETQYWVVEHCLGPLGVGTLLVKPLRHVTSVGELTPEESSEMGALLQRTVAIVNRLVQPEQVYIGLWSHAGRQRGHIHFVVQPAMTADIDALEAYGPRLQTAMFERDQLPPIEEVESISSCARELFVQE